MKTKNVFLLLMITIVMSLTTYAQLGTATATYTTGDIETDKYFYSTSASSSCPGLMTVTLPTDALILHTDVSYDMTSDENSAVNKQRSQLRCVTDGGTNEASISKGPYIYVPGTESYSRTGLDIANGITVGGDIDFELHAGAAYYRHHCSTDSIKVDNNTWIVTITYIPSGYPMQSLNPNPVDEVGYVGLDDDLTWDFGADTDTYDVFFGTDNPPTTKLVDNAAASTSGTFDPGTMTETTTYYWQVVSRNANGYTVGPVWSLTTVCGSFLTPFTEDFESTTPPDLPYCWTKIVNSTSTAYIKTSGNFGNFAPNCLRMGNNDDAAATLIYVSPQIDVGTGSLADKMVHLYVMGGDYPNLNIGTMSDPTDESTFTSYETILCWQGYKEHDIYLNDYVGTDTYIAFKLDVSSSYKTATIDDITIGDMPTCLRPEDLSADNLTINSATLSWTDLNGATTWNVEYGLAGFTPTGTPTVSGVGNPHEITGLTSATDYDFYVQTDCGSGDVSTWSSVGTFLTPCDFYEVPFSENFDGAGWGEMPACWSNILLCADGFVMNGNQGGYFQMQNGVDTNSTLMLISPPILNIVPNRIRFDAQSSMAGSQLIIGTMSNPADQSTFDSLTSVTITTAYTYEPFDVWLNSYSGTDNYFVMKHSNETTQLTFQIDNIEVEALPSCLEPIDLFISDITETSANFNWTESGDATNWEIEIGDLGFAQGTGTTHTYNNTGETNLTYNLTGLTSATSYDVYVRTDCGAGDYSVWIGPISFLSGFDAFDALPITENFESGMGITGNNYQNAQDWVIDTNLQHGGLYSAHNPYDNNGDNVLFMLGTFDFTAQTDVMFSFWQIAKTDGRYDHCYVEISTDGGETFDQLPESTYAGAGRYREDDLYTPFDGPCFDEDSYLDWGTSNTVPENTWWKKEYFNLTDYNIYDNVVIRFRLWSNAYTNRDGWYIDDIAIETSAMPDFYVNPISITEPIDPLIPNVNVGLTLGNSGGFPAGYTANVVFDELELIAANFDSGMPSDWTIVNNGTNSITWTDTTGISGKSFDGTPFAWVDGLQGYAPPVENVMDEELISPVVDASEYASGTLLLEYDQVFDADYNVGDTAKVYVYDGSNWVMIYESWTDDGSIYSGGVHKTWDVTAYANANFQIKFRYIEGSITKRGRYFAIDNVKLRASMSALDWLSLEGESTVSGVALPDVDGIASMINVQLDATTLGSIENYTADIVVLSTDVAHPLIVIPVTYWNPISSAVVTASPDNICIGETTELAVDLIGGSGGQTYSWTSNPVGFTSNLANPIASPAETTTFYVEITEETTSVSAEVLVSVSTKPNVSLEVFDDMCINEEDLELTGGLPTGGTYSGIGVDNGIFDPMVAGEGIHEISYTYANEFGCDSTAISNINVRAIPIVTLEAFDEMCIDEGELELIGGLPIGGIYSGIGVDNGIFDPIVAGEGIHEITYTYADEFGCESTAISPLNVISLPLVSLEAFDDMCINEGELELTGGLPTGGIYSGIGIDNGIFNPTVAGEGIHEITYTYADEFGCESSATNTLNVNALPLVSLEVFDDICIDEGELELTGGMPTGGIYSGIGVDNGIFDPTVAGEGIHEITYTYANEFGCESTAMSTLNVMALPLVSLEAFEAMCVDAGELELTGGLPTGGVYSGIGVDNGIFDPIVAGEGIHEITYTYADEFGCESTAISPLNVIALPIVSLEAFEAICVDAGELELTGGLPTGGIYSGVGVDNGIFDPTVAGEGIHEITYTYADEFGCESFAMSTINVTALPIVTLEAFDDMCIDEGELELTGGLPTGGVYSGIGVDNGTFDPSVAGEGIHTITYTYINSEGCENYTESNITVLPLPEVNLGLFEDVCINESAFVLTGGSPAGGEYSGVGVSDGMFDPIVAGVGTFIITYTYEDEYSCSNFDQSEIIVNDLPEVNMQDAEACVQWAEFELVVGTPEGGEYSGNGVDNGMFDPQEAGIGTHTITYTYFDDNQCENYAEGLMIVDACTGVIEIVDNLTIEVFPNPNSGKFSIMISAEMEEILSLKVIDNLGAVVYKEESVQINNNYSAEFDLSNQPKGMYFVHISTKDNNYVKKIIVQ